VTSNETVLVTGGAGFIGAHLMRALLDKGYRVRALDNLYRADAAVVDEIQSTDGAELIETDVRYRGAVERALIGVDLVVHLASIAINKSVVDPEESIEVNVVGSENVFAASCDAGVRRVVFASTASVYGDPEILPITEDGPLKPQTPYCISKLASEQLLQFYGRAKGLDWNVLRFFNVYGPGQRTDAYYTTVILTFIERLLRKEPPVIDGRGEQSMDFVHVQDVARALVLALETEHSRQVINIGTGVQTSVAQLADILIQAVGSDVEPQFRPRDVLVTRRAADISRAAKYLGWQPNISVQDGLTEMVDEAIASNTAL
jgi:UDP-glucose 4-epimerase